MRDDTVPTARDSCIAYRSWNVIRNVGDAITPYLIELLSDAVPYYGRTTQPHLIGVGSIMSMATPSSTIWGTGIISPTEYLPPLHSRQLRAVRGSKTAELLEKAGIRLGDVPLGDPGIFAADIMAREPPGVVAAPRIAVVPHHTSYGHPFYERLRRSAEVCVVNVCDDTLLPLQQIRDAEIVVSESLHGLIFAESFGKPVAWVAQDEDAPHFKYHDWFSTVRNPPPRPASLGSDFDSLLRQAERQHSVIDKAALSGAFPLDLAQATASPPRVAFRTCRQHNPFVLYIDMPGPAADDPAGSNMLGFFDRAKASWDNELLGWAERPYVLAVATGIGVLPTPAQAAAIALEMDRHHETDVAILTRRAELAARTKPRPGLAGGVVLPEPPADLNVSAMLIRPLYGKRPSSCVVLGV